MRRLFAALLGAIILTGCSKEISDRSDQPLNRAQADKRPIFIELPASASDVYFATRSDGDRYFKQFVRFTVDAKDMDQSVAALLSRCARTPALEAYDVEAEVEFRPMLWWTPKSIAHGQFRTGYWPPMYVWTDTDHETIFVYCTD